MTEKTTTVFDLRGGGGSVGGGYTVLIGAVKRNKRQKAMDNKVSG